MLKWAVDVHAYNLSTQEAEARRSWIQDQPGLHSETMPLHPSSPPYPKKKSWEKKEIHAEMFTTKMLCVWDLLQNIPVKVGRKMGIQIR
jgi:hypothetical protein